LTQNDPVLVEQVWYDVRQRNPEQADASCSKLFKLALAPGSGLYED
jgi:hypothetical protein